MRVIHFRNGFVLFVILSLASAQVRAQAPVAPPSSEILHSQSGATTSSDSASSAATNSEGASAKDARTMAERLPVDLNSKAQITTERPAITAQFLKEQGIRDQWPAGVGPRQELPTARTLDYDFSEVEVSDIVGWLEWFGVELPVTASGTLSGWLWGQRGTGGWFTFSDYRIEGEVSSPKLTLDRWEIDQAALRFGYAGGVWYIGQLRGSVRSGSSDVCIGQADLAAKIPTDPTGRIETLGSIEQVDLSALLGAFDVDLDLDTGTGTLRLTGNAPRSSADDLANWAASAILQLTEVSIRELPQAELRTEARLNSGEWSLVRGQLDWLAQPLQIMGSGRIDNDLPFRIALQGEDIALTQLLNDFGQATYANELTGSVAVSAEATGNATRGVAAASAQLTAPELLVLEQRVQALQTTITLNDQGVRLQLTSAEIAGGSLTGSSHWTSPAQFAEGPPTTIDLQLDQLDLSQLSRRIMPTSIAGVASGILAFASQRSEAASERRFWRSSGSLDVIELAGLGVNIGAAQVGWTKEVSSPEVTATLFASDGAIELDLRGQLDDQPLSDWKHSRLAHYSATGNVADFVTDLNLPAAGLDVSRSLNLTANDLASLPVRATGSFSAAGAPQNWLDHGRFELLRLETQLARRDLALHRVILLFNPDEFRLQQFQLLEGRGRIAGAAVYRRQAAGLHQLNLRLADVQLADYLSYLTADRIAQTLTGKASFETRLSKPAGDDELLDELIAGWTGTISAQLSELTLHRQSLGSFDMQAVLADEQLTADLRGQLLERTVTLSASLPRGWIDGLFEDGLVLQQPPATDRQQNPIAAEPAVHFNINWHAVELERLIQTARALPLPHTLQNRLVEFDLDSLTGIADIVANVRKTTSADDRFSGWQGELNAEMRQVRYQAVEVGQLALESKLTDELLSATLVGNLFAGELNVKARVPLSFLQADLSQANQALQPANKGLVYSANLVGIDVRRLMMFVAPAASGNRYTGLATLRSEGEINALGELQADVDVSVPNLWRGRRRLVRNLVGRFAYAQGALRVVQLNGGVAGGTIEGRGALPLRLFASTAAPTIAPREQLQFAARRIQIAELVDFLYPEYAAQFTGLVSYRGRVRFERQIEVLGSFRGSNALAFGLPIQEGHGQLRLKFNPDGSFAQLRTSNLSGTFIGGDFTGEVELRGAPSTSLAVTGRIGRGKLEQLSRAVGFEHVVGTGKFNAAINLQSRNATSLAALIGAVKIDFESGDTQSLPLLRELGRFVPVLQLASTDITGGTLHGYIGQGQLRIRDFLFLGDAFWIVGHGNAGLLSNRLDIKAVLETGGGITQQFSQAALTRLAVGIVPQAAFLAELNTLLSNRSVYFHIGGTTGKPVIQARPAQSIGKALLQNVRRQLLAAPTAALIQQAN